MAISFAPIPKFRLWEAQVVTFANATIIQGFQGRTAFKDETGALHDLFPCGLLNTDMRTLSKMTRRPWTAGIIRAFCSLLLCVTAGSYRFPI